MLEILLLIRLGKKLGAKVRSRGGRAGGYQFLLVVMWFGGEFLGAILGAIVNEIVNPNQELILLVYLFAIIGAVIGAFSAFWIADRANPPQPIDDGFDAGGYFQPRTATEDAQSHFAPGNPNNPYDQYKSDGGR